MSIKKFINQIQTFSFYLEFRLFLAGLFFLASAPSVALLLFLYPIFIGLKKNYKNLLEDKLNYFLIAASIIMTSKSIFTSLKDLNQLEGWDSILNWAGLGNWIPLFLIYFGVQIYVQNPKQRALSSKALILGTVPVIFSCFSQYFLDWYGPYELFNGFIIWYQRTRTELYQPITGLFNNPNYTGAWLALIWPLLLNYLSQKKKDGSKTKFTIVFCFSVFFIIAIGLINSRAAWLGILASIPLLFGHSVIIWLIPLLLFILFSILFCALPIFSENIKDFACFLIPKNVMTNFNDFSFSYENLPRLMIWKKSIYLISQKPLLGWGAATFPIIYLSQYGEWKGHPHNLFLELSISYGLLTSFLIFTFIGILIYKTYIKVSKGLKSKDFYARSWWTSAIVFLILHSFDIVYFDLRISIIFWIFLAGLKGILNNDQIYFTRN